MDAVITYVNGNDPVWKRDYEKYTNIPNSVTSIGDYAFSYCSSLTSIVMRLAISIYIGK